MAFKIEIRSTTHRKRSTGFEWFSSMGVKNSNNVSVWLALNQFDSPGKMKFGKTEQMWLLWPIITIIILFIKKISFQTAGFDKPCYDILAV